MISVAKTTERQSMANWSVKNFKVAQFLFTQESTQFLKFLSVLEQ